jgi:hypothetical protein
MRIKFKHIQPNSYDNDSITFKGMKNLRIHSLKQWI